MSEKQSLDFLDANSESQSFVIGEKVPNKEVKIKREIQRYLSAFFEKTLKKKSTFMEAFYKLQNEGGDFSSEVLEQVKKELQSNQSSLADIVSGTFVQSKLILKIKNGGEIVVDLGANSLEKIIIRTEAKKKEDSLKENIGMVAFVLGGLGLTFYDVLKDGTIRAKSISLTIDGQKKLIEINKNFTSLLKFEESVLGLLEERGIRFNTKLLAFEQASIADKINIGNVTDVKQYSYKDYQKDMKLLGEEKIFSETEFNREKGKYLQEVERVIVEYNNSPKEITFGRYFLNSLGEKIVRHGQHAFGIFLLPMFFKEIHKESQDITSFYKSIGEASAFGSGAWVGKTLAEKIPNPIGKGIGMVLIPLLLGGGAVYTSKKLGETFDADWWLKEKFPENEDWFKKYLGLSDEKSIMGHIASGGVFNDMVDSANFDTFFYNTSIDFNENPRVYLSQRVNTKDLRNTRVDDFKVTFLKSFFKLYRQIQSPDTKAKILGSKERIEKIKNAPENAFFQYGKEFAIKQEERIYTFWKQKFIDLIGEKVNPSGNPLQKETHSSIINLLTYNFDKIVSGELSEEALEKIISHTIEKLKITPEYTKKLEEKLDGFMGEKYKIDKALSGESVSLFKQEDLNFVSILSEEKRTFIKKIFGRLVNKQPLLDSITIPGRGGAPFLKKMIEEGKLISYREGRTTNYLTPDQIMWKELMKDKKFYVFFLRLLNYKREKDFVSNVTKYGSAEKWGDSFDQLLEKGDRVIFGREKQWRADKK